jgi:hypothetical protein
VSGFLHSGAAHHPAHHVKDGILPLKQTICHLLCPRRCAPTAANIERVVNEIDDDQVHPESRQESAQAAGEEGEEVAMAQSSPQRRRYLAARRRGLSQSEAMKEVGVSRSSAWRYDQLFKHEEAERAAVRERFSKGQPVNDDDEVLREAADRDVVLEGRPTIPIPPWDGSRAKLAEETLVGDGSFPAGLLERRQRAQGAAPPSLPSQHPMLNRRAVVVSRGAMPESQDISGRLSRPPRLPEEPPTRIMPPSGSSSLNLGLPARPRPLRHALDEIIVGPGQYLPVPALEPGRVVPNQRDDVK